MELSETTLAHLRDEAYAFLAREALLAKVEALERERANVASTRPPFGLLAKRSTREEFARSMRAVDDNEAVLRDKLAQITGIVAWLHPVIRRDVSTYLASVHPDYCQLLQVAARLDDWGRSFQGVPELLTAFVRDLRALRLALAPDKKTHALVVYEIAALRESAENLEAQEHELRVIEQAALIVAPADLAPRITFPAHPDLRRVAWVSRLAVISAADALQEVARVEQEIRDLLAKPDGKVQGQLETSRACCAERAEQVLEEYWNQLRAHARAHYVEERDVDDVIRMLSDKYIDAELRTRQQAISLTPFEARGA